MTRTATGRIPADAVALANALLCDLLPRLETRAAPFVLGVSGVQGSGKSTLATALVARAVARGIGAVALSLDDAYLSREARAVLAAEVHPLLATRGVPGTHDVALLHAMLDALAGASPAAPVALPRFDKGRDTRFAPQYWPRVTAPPRLIVLEGWCLGVPPQAPDELIAPVNALERDADADGRWRRHVDAQLAGPYAALWVRIDRLVLLRAPSFEVVAGWRGQQEAALREQGAPQAMDAAALRHFIAHYERLSRHALARLPALADVVIELDAARAVRAIHPPLPAPVRAPE